MAINGCLLLCGRFPNGTFASGGTTPRERRPSQAPRRLPQTYPQVIHRLYMAIYDCSTRTTLVQAHVTCGTRMRACEGRA